MFTFVVLYVSLKVVQLNFSTDKAVHSKVAHLNKPLYRKRKHAHVHCIFIIKPYLTNNLIFMNNSCGSKEPELRHLFRATRIIAGGLSPIPRDHHYSHFVYYYATAEASRKSRP